MKKLKKVFAVLLSVAMILGMSSTVFAAGSGIAPSSSDKATGMVTNVEPGATVTAYRIVEPEYNAAGNAVKGYKASTGVTLAKPTEPTSDEVTGIAANATLLTSLTPVELKEGTANGKTVYSADLNPGYWVVIVTGAEKKVYNPMLIGVYYSISGTDNDLATGTVDANSNWTLVTENAYAKSSEPTMNKVITGSTTPNGIDNTDEKLNGTEGKGNDVAIGDTVKFQIDADVPSYSKQYTNITYKITDSLKGLDKVRNIKVYLNADPKTATTEELVKAEVKPGRETFKAPIEGGTSYEINFASSYIKGLSTPNKKDEVSIPNKFYVTYEATLAEDAGINFDANTNTAKLTYSNDPSNEDSVKEIEKKTYTYTFGIDANLYGENEDSWNKVTEELFKTGEVTSTEEGTITTKGIALDGAEFKLTNKDTGATYTAISGTVKDAAGNETTVHGALQFLGLDAGEYVLEETKAPEGYSLNDAKVPVVITATYNEDGTLKSYEIKIDGKATSTYTATYKTTNDKKTDVIENIGPGNVGGTKVEWETKNENGSITTMTVTTNTISTTYPFVNTKLGELPSTGGIGTIIFTVGGCLIMVVAAALYFANRRKAANSESK